MTTTIEIGNLDKGQASIVKDRIHGKSYMDFRVICAPLGGSYHVFVESDYDGTPEEIQEMLLFVMATELTEAI